jgi:iron complex transport system ATP-binding protein
LIAANNITVRFGEREVLRDVSMSAEAGSIVALLGPNGAGKTTLLRACNGTVPIVSGHIELDGSQVADLSRREIAKNIAVVAQENETKFPVTVFEFVLAGRFARGAAFGWETPADKEAAERALSLCDLSDFGDRFMNELSGGERQRVVLARALAAETRILLLDEPTANLDLSHQGLMLKLVRERCTTLGAAAIVITHDLNLASEFADSVVMLKAGRVVATGAPAQVLSEENVREVYQVNVLLDKNPASGKLRVTTVY